MPRRIPARSRWLQDILPLLLGLLAVLNPPSTSAQSSGGVPEMPRAFVGGGFGITSRDPDARMRLYQDPTGNHWTIDGGIRLRHLFSAGVEYSRPRPLLGSTLVGVGRTQIAGKQTEHLTLGVLRGRVAGSGVWAFDLVGGAGILVHRHFSGTCTPPVDPRTDCPTTQRSLYGKAPAFAVGFDIPVQPATHLAFVFQPRYYVLQRGDNEASTTFQFEHHSSTRFALGFGARVMW